MAAQKDDGDGGGLMPVAELKPLLRLARRRGVSCAVAITKAKQGVILLHRRMKPKKLREEMKRQAKAAGMDLDTASVRFGRVTVDGASDSGLARIEVNKPAPGPVRVALLPTLRKAGCQRCELVVNDGLEAEPDDGEDADDDEDGAGEDGTGMDGAAPGTAAGGAGGSAGDAALLRGDAAPADAAGAAVTDVPGRAGSDAAGGAAGSGMAEVRTRLAGLAGRVKDPAASGLSGTDGLRAAAAAARDALASGDAAAAGEAADRLERLLGGAASGGGARPGPAGTAAAPDAPASRDGEAGRLGQPSLLVALRDVSRGIPSAVAADPSRKRPLAALLAGARGRIEAGDMAAATAGIESLRQALGAPAGPDAGPVPVDAARSASENWPMAAGDAEAMPAVMHGTGPAFPGSPGGDPLLTLVQRGPGRQPRGTGPGGKEPSLPEVMRTARFGNAARELRQLEPNNRQLSYVAPPGWVPSEANVGNIEFELGAAHGRATGRPNSDPLTPVPGSSLPIGVQVPSAVQPVVPRLPSLLGSEPRPRSWWSTTRLACCRACCTSVPSVHPGHRCFPGKHQRAGHQHGRSGTDQRAGPRRQDL